MNSHAVCVFKFNTAHERLSERQCCFWGRDTIHRVSLLRCSPHTHTHTRTHTHTYTHTHTHTHTHTIQRVSLLLTLLLCVLLSVPPGNPIIESREALKW